MRWTAPVLTYTVDTLEELAREGRWCADDYLILGMDALEHFHRWKAPERILQLSRLAVAAREGYQGVSLDRLVDQFPGAAGRVVQLPVNLAGNQRHRGAAVRRTRRFFGRIRAGRGSGVYPERRPLSVRSPGRGPG